MEELRCVTKLLLEPRTAAHSLRTEALALTRILADSRNMSLRHFGDIPGSETQTSGGLALSPNMAVKCADDFVRTTEFIRGLHAAIVDLRKQIPNRPVRVLYAGCGPLATLAVPLMTVLSAPEATFTLLDIHPESIESAKSIVANLGRADSVTSFETVNATTYQACPENPPDILLIETMQACLEAEPQVAIARHLLKQSPDAILIPQEVRIDLSFVNPTCEFNLDRRERNETRIPPDSIPVAPVFALNRETIKSWEGHCTDRLPALAVQIPHTLAPHYQPMFLTTIRVYEDHILKAYDSGLTSPRAPSIQGTFNPGDTLQFHYELGRHPRLNCIEGRHFASDDARVG